MWQIFNIHWLVVLSFLAESATAQVVLAKKPIEQKSNDLLLGTGLYSFTLEEAADQFSKKPGEANLKFNNASTLYKSEFVDCLNKQDVPAESQLKVLTPVVLKVSCSQIKNESDEIFTPENCKLMDSCVQIKTAKDEMNYMNISLPTRMAAEDLAGLLLEDSLPEMEKLEMVRQYSEMKYGSDFTKTCSSRFDYSANKKLRSECDKSIMEQGYLNFHNSCKASVKLSCYQHDTDYGKGLSEKESALQNFMLKRVEKNSLKAVNEEDEIFGEITKILTSGDRNSTKLTNVFTKLSNLSRDKKLDPVLSFDDKALLPGKITSSPHYDFFYKLVSQDLSAVQIKREIEKYRKNYAKKILAEDCKKIPSYTSICQKVTTSSNGKGGIYPNRPLANDRLKRLDPSRLEVIKKAYPVSNLSDKDAETVLNYQRCVAMGVVAAPDLIARYGINYSLGNGDIPGNPGGLGLLSNYGRYSSPSSSGAKKGANNGEITFDINSSIKKNPDLVVSSFHSELKAVAEKDLTFPVKERSSLLPRDDLGGSNVNYRNLEMSPSVGNSFTSIDGIQSNASNSSSSMKGTSLSLAETNAKIEELTKKLSNKEESLAKSKEEMKSNPAAPEFVGSRAEDLQTIAELQKQISDLKNSVSTISPSGANPIDYKEIKKGDPMPSTSLQVSSKNEGESDINEETSQQAFAKSQRTAQADVTSSPSVAESSMSSQAGTAENAASVKGGPTSGPSKILLSLTKSDELSQERIAEVIGNKIIELGGQSFEIEENGVKIEIVPEVKNGKIVLDEKGKPRFLKKIKTPDKKREPAQIVDKADLKRIEEEALKKERAEYLKLKDITKQAVDKK